MKKTNNTNMSLHFRQAAAADTAIVMEFIRELAEYEHLTHRLTISEETLRQWLETQKIAVLLAYVGDRPAGFALYYPVFSTFAGKEGIYLEDIFVRPAFRRQGIATAMFGKLTEVVQSRSGNRIDWMVLDWNKNSINFYRQLGAVPVDGWLAYRLDVEAKQSGTTQPRLSDKTLPNS